MLLIEYPGDEPAGEQLRVFGRKRIPESAAECSRSRCQVLCDGGRDGRLAAPFVSVPSQLRVEPAFVRLDGCVEGGAEPFAIGKRSRASFGAGIQYGDRSDGSDD